MKILIEEKNYEVWTILRRKTENNLKRIILRYYKEITEMNKNVLL